MMHICDTALCLPALPCHAHAGSVMMVHAVNGAMKVFVASKHGVMDGSQPSTLIRFLDIQTRLQLSILSPIGPNAFYDKKEKRFVVTWATYGNAGGTPLSEASPLIVCASETEDAYGTWTCWALRSSLESPSSVDFCESSTQGWIPNYPQCECCHTVSVGSNVGDPLPILF